LCLSNVKYVMSNVEYNMSNVEHGASTVKDVMSNVKHVMSNVFAECQIWYAKRKLSNVQYVMSSNKLFSQFQLYYLKVILTSNFFGNGLGNFNFLSYLGLRTKEGGTFNNT
jgi:hypothetical protein